MKKVVLFSFMTIGSFILAVILFNPQTVSGSGKSIPAAPGTALPDSIMKFVQKACMDCHADDGNFMAKGKINFSVWDTYDAKKQAEKAQAMCKVLTKGSMPKSGWKKNNPDRVPTKADVDMVCRWAGSLQK